MIRHIKSYFAGYPRLRAVYNILRYRPYQGPYYLAGGSPELKYIDRPCSVLMKESIGNYIAANSKRELRFLDIGGRHGRTEVKEWAEGTAYFLMDIQPETSGSHVITGDICDCPGIEDSLFDIAYSSNVFEHITEPWRAAEEIGRILRPGGISLTQTLFSWRYHPVPRDYWRYTHSALEFIFEKYGRLETVDSGYDINSRRANIAGGKIEKGLDGVPIDEYGGWREHWVVFHIGRKPR